MPKQRQKAALPPAPVKSDIGSQGRVGHGPIVPQTKRQQHFEDKAAEVAAKFGWEGEPLAELNGIRVQDAQNFIRKTLHEIHIAAVGGAKPALDHVGEHLGLDADDATELGADLRALFDAEAAEVGALDEVTKKRTIKANADEDSEFRKRAIVQNALGSDA